MNSWIREIIDTPFGQLSRYDVINAFVEDLIPFVESRGYAWNDTSSVADRLATGLFVNHGKHYLESDWSMIPAPNTQEAPEDLHHFYYTIDGESWAAFWLAWDSWIDVSLDTDRGSDRRLDIQDFVWRQLNLERSPQSEVVNELCGYYDYEDEEREMDWVVE
jgi:hypothetical protein